MQHKSNSAVCFGKRRWWPYSASSLAARALLIVLLSVPFAAFSSGEAQAKGGCHRFGVCLEVLKHNGMIDFYAVNKNPYLPVSSRIDLVPSNLRITKGENRKFVLKGYERRFLFRLERKDKKKTWKYSYEIFWVKGDYAARHDHSYIYQLPYKNGKMFKVAQGCNGKFTHKGRSRFAIDFAMPVGTPIHAARPGKVVDVKEDSNERGRTKAYRRKGNFVILQHEDGTLAYYYHLKQNGAAVELGDWVQLGELIGYSGNTGQSTGPHLHFSVTEVHHTRIRVKTIPTRFFTAGGALSCPRRGIALEAYGRTANAEDPIAQLRQDAIKLVGSAPAD